MSDKITKLSEAIRLGTTFRPQCFGKPFTRYQSCALGAAYEAVFSKPRSNIKTHTIIAKLQKRFPSLHIQKAHLIMEWNDRFHITREEIADRLEQMGH